jgi:molybdenum cofactor cytidylyltransferase
MQKEKLAALIIAAGYSSRMHDFKPLLPLGKTIALVRLIQSYQICGITNIYVVTGHNQEEIVKVLEDFNVQIIYNEDYEKGMFCSIQKGVEAIDERIEAFYMQPVDIPLIKPQSLESLSQAYRQKRKGIIYPVFLDRKGHPPLIDMKYKEYILNSKGEGGLKKVLQAFDHDAFCVAVCDRAVLMDMDTKEDYETLLKYEALHVPTKEECLAIMLLNKVPNHIIKHCEAVEKSACRLYEMISPFEQSIDKDLLSAAALLHDIARQEKDHAQIGAARLEAMGYANIGEVIATHMDIKINPKDPLTEKELLFLADKLVAEDQICDLEARFAKAFKKCEGNLDAQSHISKRLEAARLIIKKIESLTKEAFSYG